MAEPLFELGQQVEDYIIEKQVGRGGMAELFLAKDLVLKRRVVIKVLSPIFSKKGDFKRQFLKEARIQANLDNPYIVHILRMFDYQYRLCLVMQYIKGTDLARVIKKAKNIKAKKGEEGALSAERAVHIFLQILEGIGFAHKYRVIHGDIKPSNVLLDRQGRAKVSDFGLSFLYHHGNKGQREMIQGGTPYYMSPERIFGEDVDFRSDIYSLGVTFYNMLTGKFPSGDKKKSNELLEFHLDGSLERSKRILDHFKDIRPRIKKAILKAIEKDPNNRHQSCLEFSLSIKEEATYDMYSELLRLSLLTKKDLTLAERAYLDKIAERKRLSPEEARDLEINIRKEIRLPPLDFIKEYKKAFKDILLKGREKDNTYLDDLDRTYVKNHRISKTEARLLREKVGNV